MIYLYLFLFLFSCARVEKKQQEESLPLEEKTATFKDDYLIKSYTVRPGEVVKITFKDLEKFKNKKLFCKDRYIHSYTENYERIAFVAETYFSELKPFDCKMGDDTVVHIGVLPKKFHRERLNVAKKMIFPSKKDRIRIRREQAFLNKTYASSGERPFFEQAFQVPLESLVTSVYGTKRIYNNQKHSQHLGTDFRAKVGKKIKSANSGKVVVSRNLYYTGNTVTIDHGLGIFSIYGHLSKLKVTEGEHILSGTVVGLSGATGRVTGPHLHWGVKVNGHFIEGDSLVRESQ